MDVSTYLNIETKNQEKTVKQIVFKGEPFTPQSLLSLRDKLIGSLKFGDEEYPVSQEQTKEERES
jgi:hypothetical protein